LPTGIKPFRLTRKAARYDGQGYSLLARRIVNVESLGSQPARAIVIDSATGAYISSDYVAVLDGLSFGSCHVKRIAAVVRRSSLASVA
jgi:hypothetical protein